MKPSFITGEDVKWYGHFRELFGSVVFFFFKLNIYSLQFSKPIPKYSPKRN